MAHLLQEGDDGLHGLVAGLTGLQYQLLRHLVGASLQHHHGIGRAGQAQVQAALFHLRDDGVENQLPINVARPHRPHRPHKGDVGDSEGR